MQLDIKIYVSTQMEKLQRLSCAIAHQSQI